MKNTLLITFFFSFSINTILSANDNSYLHRQSNDIIDLQGKRFIIKATNV